MRLGAQLGPKPTSADQAPDGVRAAAGRSVGADELGDRRYPLPHRTIVVNRRRRKLVVGPDADVEDALTESVGRYAHPSYLEPVHLTQPHAVIGDHVEGGLAQNCDVFGAGIRGGDRRCARRYRMEGSLLRPPYARLGVGETGGLVGRQLAAGVDDQVDGVEAGAARPGDRRSERASTRFGQVDPSRIALSETGATTERLRIGNLVLGVFGDEASQLDGRQLGSPLGVQLSSVSVDVCFLRREP